MAVSITLTRGQVALVDDQDRHLADLSWIAKPIERRSGGFYAYRMEGRTSLYMHRLILNAPRGMLVDHVNGNGLDNRRSNIRLATRSQNVTNRVATSEIGFRGVERTYRIAKPWRACLYDGKQRTVVGRYATAIEAAAAYDRAALAKYGSFAKLNFPQPANSNAPQRSAA